MVFNGNNKKYTLEKYNDALKSKEKSLVRGMMRPVDT